MTNQEYKELLEEVKNGKNIDTSKYKIIEPSIEDVLTIEVDDGLQQTERGYSQGV